MFARFNWLVVVLGMVWCSVAPAQSNAVELRVGVYNNPPKIFFDDSGNAAGSFIALLQEIGRTEGWALRFQPCEWEQCLDLLERGELDLMPDVARTPERERRFDFHDVAALSSWSQLYRKPTTKIESLVDLQGRKVAVLASGVQRDALRNLLEGIGVSVELVGAVSVAQAFAMVQRGEVDAAAASYHFGDYSAPQFGLVGTPVVFNPAKLYFAAPKDRHGPVLVAIDRVLVSWQREAGSPYYAILRQWGAPQPTSRIPDWIVHLLLGVAGAGIGLGGVSMWLRHRVRLAVGQVLAQRQELEATLRAVPDLLFEMDHEGRYLQVHTNQPELLVAQRELLLGKLVGELMPGEAASAVMQAIVQALAQGHAGGHRICLPLPDGEHWFELSAARKENALGKPATVMLLSRDVTQQVRDQEEIARLADYDHLTNLPNRLQLRRLYERTAARVARQGQSLAVVFLDVDHFKRINDSLGHSVGRPIVGGAVAPVAAVLARDRHRLPHGGRRVCAGAGRYRCGWCGPHGATHPAPATHAV